MADAPVPTGDQIRAVWEELDRPGPEKLQVALRKRGFFAPTVKVLREHFFKYQSSRQVFQPPPKYRGHAYSEGMDRRWMADIMQMPEAEYGGKRYKYALICLDIFSRFVWGALVDSPMQADEGYREVLERAGKGPSVLITDGDPGFQTPGFKKALGGTHHELKTGANDLSVVDRFIFYFKRKQRQQELDGERPNWAEQLQRRIAAFNHTGAPALYHSAPADLRGPHGEIENKELYFNRQWDESGAMRDNAAAIEQRAERLHGAFRTLAPFPGPRRRADDPVWSVQPRRVRRVDGAFVEDEQGNRFPTKEVLSVPDESTELRTPAPKLNAKARDVLRRYADRGRAFLLGQEDHRASATKFYYALAAEGNVKEALRLARVATDAVVRSIVTVFPDMFRMESGGRGGSAFVELLAPEPETPLRRLRRLSRAA
jgi:hypothetical protein